MKTTVILDLEWTSWKYNVDRKWQKKEIIQIGAIKINNKYKIIGEINIYVKPKFNPILSNYIKKLTGITQNKIDNNGLPFKKAYEKFNIFSKNSKIISNGVDGIINTLQFQGSHLIWEHEFQCTIGEHEFNSTYNTTVRDQTGDFPWDFANFTTSSFWKPYITTIGLYNDAFELVVIAKLG